MHGCTCVCDRARLIGAAVNAVHECEEAHDMEGREDDCVCQDLRFAGTALFGHVPLTSLQCESTGAFVGSCCSHLACDKAPGTGTPPAPANQVVVQPPVPVVTYGRCKVADISLSSNGLTKHMSG